MSYDELKAVAVRAAIALMAGAAVWLTVKYALLPAVPVVIALAVSALLRPAADVFSKRTGIPKKAAGGVIAVVTVLVAGFLSVIVTAKLAGELGGFLSGIVEGLGREDNVLRRAVDFFVNLRERIPLFDKLGSAFGPDTADRVYTAATELLENGVGSLSAATASFAGGVVTSLPGFAFAVTVAATGIFYLTTDGDGVKKSALELLPPSVRDALRSARSKTAGGLSGYLRAYLILMLVTFCELFAGFLILGFRYSFLIAATVAFVDFLPVLGSGTVLWPWAAVLFVSGDVKRAIGLVVLLGVTYVVRQIIEPRLLGRYMGHHPFVSLLAAYFGFILLGIPGMIAAPVVVFVLKALFGTETGD